MRHWWKRLKDRIEVKVAAWRLAKAVRSGGRVGVYMFEEGGAFGIGIIDAEGRDSVLNVRLYSICDLIRWVRKIERPLEKACERIGKKPKPREWDDAPDEVKDAYERKLCQESKGKR